MGKSVHFLAWYDNFNFLWLTRINMVHFLVKNGPIFPIVVLFASFLPKYKKRFKTSLNFICFVGFEFSEILLTSRFWNFEDKLQLMETFSSQNFNIFEISTWKQASGVISIIFEATYCQLMLWKNKTWKVEHIITSSFICSSQLPMLL